MRFIFISIISSLKLYLDLIFINKLIFSINIFEPFIEYLDAFILLSLKKLGMNFFIIYGIFILFFSIIFINFPIAYFFEQHINSNKTPREKFILGFLEFYILISSKNLYHFYSVLDNNLHIFNVFNAKYIYCFSKHHQFRNFYQYLKSFVL